MAHDETASKSKWAIHRTPAWRSTAAKEISPVEEEITPPAYPSPGSKTPPLSGARVPCVPIATFFQEKQKENPDNSLDTAQRFHT
jgi:hypothetical protein